MYNIFKYCKTLELDKILSLLANETTMDEAADLAVSIRPTNDYAEVKSLLKQTEDAYLLTAKYSSPSFYKVSDVASVLARAEAGSVLTMKELLKVSQLLSIIRSVKNWRETCSSVSQTTLDEFFDSLYPNRYFEDKIAFIIKSEDEMNDNASDSLSDIRRKIRSASANIRSRFDKIIRDGSKSKYLQDAIVTQRDGRYVVPVKSEYRNEIPGIVHDTSASGATLFVEPMVIVELNNELRVLQTKEKVEIEKILSELSAEVGVFSESIRTSYSTLIKLDVIFAKASLAYKMKASIPHINTDGKVYLKNARHPLIDGKKIVPITISIGQEYDSLIITGPNTGGKTVTLKTVGLLSLMTMCGLMIPVDDNSDVAIFDRILVDIGDEQSIEQSLSTFSSHMVNIINIINNASENSLVLLDELGGGTDPVEGAALARSILLRLHRMRARTVATTHYAELKAYALDTPGVQNACFEFDVETLKPTYKLMVGVPGKSNAFAIAGALGLDDEIISEARKSISEDNLRFEKIAQALEESKRQADKERKEVVELRLSLAKEREKVLSHLADIEKKKELIVTRSREEAAQIIEKARFESNQLLNSMEELKKEMNSDNSSMQLSKAKQIAKKGISDIENLTDPVVERANDNYVLPRVPFVGDTVLIVSLNKKATVSRVDEKNKKIYASTGNLNLWIDFDDIRFSSVDKNNSEASKTRKKSSLKSKALRNVSSEIDIRGLASDEGIVEVDRYIDEAVLVGIETVTIIHGKGTGVLRTAIHSHLRKHINVDSFRVGTFGEGENGVTIVTLKK